MERKGSGIKIAAAVLVLAVLAGAFFFGGNAPGVKGPAAGQEVQTSDVLEGQKSDDTADKLPDAGVQSGIPENPADEPDSGTKQEASETPQQPSGSDANPAPVEPQQAVVTNKSLSCTISISCATILDNMDWLDPEKVDIVPADGWILRPVKVEFKDGESVFDVLQRTCREKKIHMEFSDTPMYNSAYIEGIYNLYEFDCGELSGWMYKVNDWFPNYGCSRYQLKDGDVICWVYTCDLGNDVGGGYSAN